jgi:hypothetical protein
MTNSKRMLALLLSVALAACGDKQSEEKSTDNKEKKATASSGVFGYSRKQVDDVSTYYMLPKRFDEKQFEELAKRYVQAYASIEQNDEVAALMTIKGYKDESDGFKRKEILTTNRAKFDEIYKNKDGRIALTLKSAGSIYPYDFEKKYFRFRIGTNSYYSKATVYSMDGYGYAEISVQGIPGYSSTLDEKDPMVYRPSSEEEAKEIESRLAKARGASGDIVSPNEIFYGRVVKAYMDAADRPHIVIVPDRVDFVLNDKVLFSVNAKQLEEFQTKAENDERSTIEADKDVAKVLGVKKFSKP